MTKLDPTDPERQSHHVVQVVLLLEAYAGVPRENAPEHLTGHLTSATGFAEGVSLAGWGRAGRAPESGDSSALICPMSATGNSGSQSPESQGPWPSRAKPARSPACGARTP